MDIHRRGFLGGASAAAAAAMMHGAAPASAAVQRLSAGGRWSQSFRPPLGLGLGGVPLAGGFKPTSNADAQAALEAAWDAGVRYFDTSPQYAFGRSERRMGQFLSEKPRGDYILSTKVGRIFEAVTPKNTPVWPSPPPFKARYDFSAAGVRRSIEDSLQRLGVDRIDMVFIHDLSPDNADMGERWTEYFEQARVGAMPELIRMREEGLIRGWGLGVNRIDPLLQTLKVSDPDIFLSATQYSLIRHRESLQRLQPACLERGVPLIIGSPLNVGFLSGADRIDYLGTITPDLEARRRRIAAIARAHGTDMRTTALRFASAPKSVAAVLVGARNGRQMAEDAASMRAKLPADLWAELKAGRLIPADAPTP